MKRTRKNKLRSSGEISSVSWSLGHFCLMVVSTLSILKVDGSRSQSLGVLEKVNSEMRPLASLCY